MIKHELSTDEYAFWTENHYLRIPQALAGEQVTQLKQWTQELADWPESPGQWMKYFETPAHSDQRQLCRVENFVQYHSELDNLIRGNGVMTLLARLMNEPALLFKEKINFKLPGGSGFGAHQDAPAFTTFGHNYHITMLIAVDDSNVENGCLEMSNPVPVYETLTQEADGTIARDLESQMQWTPLPTQAGDVVFFDSYIPHRSKPNTSQTPRRALYITYNRASEGDVREDYYAHKRQAFPPECERIAGVDYSETAGPYNLGNPIR